ncbi:MAG: Lon family ATP-dependent protease [Acidobacteria bacterium]|nr:Lon family ATP-dependent protease [Acidobacteriota bacterium]
MMDAPMTASTSRRRIRVGVVLWGLLWMAAAAPEQSGAQTAQAPGSLPSAIPIFPLQDVMLFPGASRPLHIFEPRYREMVADALEGDRIIGMVMLHAGYEEEYAGNPPIYDIGCAGVITNVQRLEDGRYNIVLGGLVKFRITSEDRSRSYRVAEIDAIPETLGDADRDVLRGHRPLLMELLASVAPGQAPTPDELSDEMLVNGLSQFLGMSALDRLDLLRREGPLARAEALIGLLERGELSR